MGAIVWGVEGCARQALSGVEVLGGVQCVSCMFLNRSTTQFSSEAISPNSLGIRVRSWSHIALDLSPVSLYPILTML